MSFLRRMSYHSFAYLYERTGSVWPAVVAHAFNNLLAITFQVTT